MKNTERFVILTYENGRLFWYSANAKTDVTMLAHVSHKGFRAKSVRTSNLEEILDLFEMGKILHVNKPEKDLWLAEMIEMDQEVVTPDPVSDDYKIWDEEPSDLFPDYK